MTLVRCATAAALAAALSSLAPARAAPIEPMPYPEAIYFSTDLVYLSCVYADIPDWVCAPAPLPLPDPRKALAVPTPLPDPRKGAAQ